jgi:hypothetical protein
VVIYFQTYGVISMSVLGYTRSQFFCLCVFLAIPTVEGGIVMKKSTITILSLIVMLVLAALAVIGLNSINPFIKPPVEGEDAILITFIFVDENDNVIFSEELATSSGNLEGALTELDEKKDSLSLQIINGEAGVYYETFTFNQVTYGSALGNIYILLFSDDEEYTTDAYGNPVVVSGKSYDSLTDGASLVPVKEGVTYVIAARKF